MGTTRFLRTLGVGMLVGSSAVMSTSAWAGTSATDTLSSASGLVTTDTQVNPEEFFPDGQIQSLRFSNTVLSYATAVYEAGSQAESTLLAQNQTTVTTLQQTGGVGERMNLVILGDGYTSAEQQKFITHARNTWENTVKQAPFSTYRQAFNVYAVFVESSVSGVGQNGSPNGSPAGMYYGCNGTARLLCIDTQKAAAFARQAPRADQILALANSTTYGGGGYLGANMATAAGDNSQATEIAIHEFGHSMAGLVDEYGYNNMVYNGSEPRAANATTARDGSKWAHLAGQQTPDGGTIGSFEGGYEKYNKGIYRPSENSKMRTLGKPFNLVALEAFAKVLAPKMPNGSTPGTPGSPVTPEPTVPQPTSMPTTPGLGKPVNPGSPGGFEPVQPIHPTAGPTGAPTTAPTLSPIVAPTATPTPSTSAPNQPGGVYPPKPDPIFPN